MTTLEFPTTATTDLTTTRKRVCTLAYDLAQNQGMSSSEAMSWAWYLVRTYPEAMVVTFEKSNGTITSRLVEPWNKHYTPKGTGRPTKENQILLADMDKHHAGLNATIIASRSRLLKVA